MPVIDTDEIARQVADETAECADHSVQRMLGIVELPDSRSLQGLDVVELERTHRASRLGDLRRGSGELAGEQDGTHQAEND